MISVKATDECLQTFEKMKLKKKHAYVIFVIAGDKIEVEKEMLKADAGEEDEYALKYIADLKEAGINQ